MTATIIKLVTGIHRGKISEGGGVNELQSNE